MARKIVISETYSWIDAARSVVDSGAACYVDQRDGSRCPRGRTAAVLVDLTTASMLTQIYDALSESSRARFDAMPITKAVSIGWQLVR